MAHDHRSRSQSRSRSRSSSKSHKDHYHSPEQTPVNQHPQGPSSHHQNSQHQPNRRHEKYEKDSPYHKDHHDFQHEEDIKKLRYFADQRKSGGGEDEVRVEGEHSYDCLRQTKTFRKSDIVKHERDVKHCFLPSLLSVSVAVGIAFSFLWTFPVIQYTLKDGTNQTFTYHIAVDFQHGYDTMAGNCFLTEATVAMMDLGMILSTFYPTLM